MSIDDKPRSVFYSAARTDETVYKIQITELSRMTWSLVQEILTKDLEIKMVAATFLSRLRTTLQKKILWKHVLL